MDKISWVYLSANPSAIHLLEQNMDKINWDYLSSNPNAIHLLEKNVEKINWSYLSANPNAMHLLKQNMSKINWRALSQNPNIFTYDYNKMKLNRINSGITEGLKVFQPQSLMRICMRTCKRYSINCNDFMEYI
jgi:hypothetical protein